MEAFYPVAVWQMMQAFRGCFSKPTWSYFLGYIWALMVCPGRKCMTKVANGCFPIARSISSWERFLAEYIWDMNKCVAVMLQLLLQQLHQSLLYRGTTLVVALDTTLIAKASRKMFGVQNWHDSSGNADRGSTIRGHHWSVLALVSRWQERWLSWPLLARLITTRGQWKQTASGLEAMSFWDLVLSNIYHLQSLVNFPMLVVADAYFAKAPFINPLHAAGVHVVTRLRGDAKGWDDPTPNPPGKRGPKPKRGKEWRLAELLKHLSLQTAQVFLYGRRVNVRYVSKVMWLREVQQKVTVVVLKAAKPILFISTDLKSPANH